MKFDYPFCIQWMICDDKKLLEIPFPRFIKTNKNHKKLVQLGLKCSKIALLELEKALLEFKGELKAHHIGRIRVKLRECLRKELSEIDEITESLLMEQMGSEISIEKFITI